MYPSVSFFSIPQCHFDQQNGQSACSSRVLDPLHCRHVSSVSSFHDAEHDIESIPNHLVLRGVDYRIQEQIETMILSGIITSHPLRKICDKPRFQQNINKRIYVYVNDSKTDWRTSALWTSCRNPICTLNPQTRTVPEQCIPGRASMSAQNFRFGYIIPLRSWDNVITLTSGYNHHGLDHVVSTALSLADCRCDFRRLYSSNCCRWLDFRLASIY